MPEEYGIVGPTEGRGLLPWSWGAERLSHSHGHWLATVGPDGRPHVMIVWGVWLENRLCFATSRRSRKARNLAGNPRCVVCTEQAEEPVVLEGDAQEVTEPDRLRAFEAAYRSKYGEGINTEAFPVYAVRPTVAFGFISTPEDWAATATRWEFPRP